MSLREKDRVSAIDKAIIIVEHEIRKKKRRRDDMLKRIDLNENQKIFIADETKMIESCETLIKQSKRSYGDVLGKLPPQDIPMESAVLGGIILERPAYEKVKGFLLPDHFYLDSHKLIYEALLRMNGPSDLLSLVNELRRSGHIEQIGGPSYVAELTMKVSSTTNVEYHARVMIELALRREMIMKFSHIVQDAYEEKVDTFELLEYAESQFRYLRSWIK